MSAKVKPKTYLIGIGFALMALSCKKDPPLDPPCYEDGLPCLTTTGGGLFACKVNGQPWIAETPANPFGPSALYVTFEEAQGDLYVVGTRKNEDKEIYDNLRFWGFGISDTGYHQMEVTIENQYGYKNHTGAECDTYYHNINDKGFVQIVYLDQNNNIMSGYFEMTLINNSCEDSVMHISDGRFDFYY